MKEQERKMSNLYFYDTYYYEPDSVMDRRLMKTHPHCSVYIYIPDPSFSPSLIVSLKEQHLCNSKFSNQPQKPSPQS